METVFWQEFNSNNFNVFIRDLFSSVNINLKYMIEDLDKEEKKDLSMKKSNYDKKKKKCIKKKDLIIQEQNQKRYQKNIDEDKKTCLFLLDNINDKNPYLNFDKLKTDEGKLEYKFQLLERYWSTRKKHLSHVLNLFFHLKYSKRNQLSEKRTTILTKIDSILKDYDYKFFMFEELGHLLPPLNFWDKGMIHFDSWQKGVIQKIKSNRSIIIKAPTSSGKTFIAMSAGIIHKKVLYICPVKPIVYQVGSYFTKMGYKVHYLIENQAHLSYHDKTNIFIGTPDIIEKYIYKINTDFDYAIFDEIHNLTREYENIIKLLDCNFLALSATIQNSEELLNNFKEIYSDRDIDFIEYNQRFINQQRWIWDSQKVKKLHPCICFDTNDSNSLNDISFTPNDCAVLYQKLNDTFEDTPLEDKIDEISPDNYFKEDRLLTLNDAKEYEILLKKELQIIHQSYPKEIKSILTSFEHNYINNEARDDFINLFNNCKKNNLLPMILFHTKEEITKEIFELINIQLQKEEMLEYPYHYIILEKKKELYKIYSDKRKNYLMNLKIKTKDVETEKKEKMMDFDKNEKERYLIAMIDFYNKCIQKCKNTENETNKIKNLKKELLEFSKNPDLRDPDIFKKHPKYCYTKYEPMSGEEIRCIRKEIYKTTGKKIDYESSLFQLLKRGIGIYIQSNPEEYNWIIQRLMSQKKLGIIISDRTLCLGINLPILSVCFTGYKNPDFTKEDYLQMSGRAGRRGHDSQGNIIFHGIDNYKKLMKGQLPKLVFKNKELLDGYSYIQQLNPRIKTKRLHIKSTDNSIQNHKLYKLIWYLRYYENSISFVNTLDKYERKLFMIHEKKREYDLFNFICQNLLDIHKPDFLICYKQNKIIPRFHSQMIQINNICKDICNSLHPITYKIIVDTSKIIFERIKKIIH